MKNCYHCSFNSSSNCNKKRKALMDAVKHDKHTKHSLAGRLGLRFQSSSQRSVPRNNSLVNESVDCECNAHSGKYAFGLSGNGEQ